MKKFIGILLITVLILTVGCQKRTETEDMGILQENFNKERSQTSQNINVETTEETQNIEILKLEDLPIYEYETREIPLINNGQKIYGIAYIPKTEKERVPLVISSHGLGGSHRSNVNYAKQLAGHGIAVYCFDFRGGGGKDSEGSTKQMSVMTEVSDLEVVLEAAKSWDFVDINKIVLLGTSQGGIVSAIVAARHTEEVSGLILMYPAFMISDTIHEVYDSLDEVPKSFRFKQFVAGYPYIADMWDYNVYSEIGNFNKKVLLMHGNEDIIVPISYSEHAAEVYPDVEYFVIDGAGHGFGGTAFDKANRHIFDYLQEIEILEVK